MNIPPLIPRQTRPDAEDPRAVYLIKNLSALRPTRQIRMNAVQATERGKKLVLVVPSVCAFHASLDELIRSTGGLIERKDLP